MDILVISIINMGLKVKIMRYPNKKLRLIKNNFISLICSQI